MNLSRRSCAALTFAFAFAFASGPAAAKELAGATMPDSVTVAGKTLKLNGMGLRKKAMFKVYVGGLYLEAPASNASAILASDAPKALKMHFLRSVDREKLVETFQEGFTANSPQKAPAQKAGIDKLLATVTDVKDGSVTTYTYAPGTGTVVNRDGKDVATIEGKEFAEVLFSLWLGPKPPSEDLQKGLLGR
ncbi:MAG: chalcone isomerase family protein [Holophagales bacterium]|nr:chalcone isomerase family protein [Holophagales bacterium]